MGIFKKANNIYITVRDTYTSISGSSYEEAEEVIIEATNGDLELVSQKKVVMQGLGKGKGDDKNNKTQLLVTKVEGKNTAIPYEKVTYKVTKYNQDKVSENDKKRIQWAIKIDGEQKVLKEKGEKLVLTIKDEWAEKEIIVMPFLIKPTEEVSKKVKIYDKSLVVYVNGYWNKDLPYAGEKIGKGYWGNGLRRKATKEYDNSIKEFFINGADSMFSSGKLRFEKGMKFAEERIKNTSSKFYTEVIKKKRKIIMISHSMGAAFLEGVMNVIKKENIEIEKVVHFSPADTSDFSVTFPEITYQIDILYDPVLMFKNVNDQTFIKGIKYAGLVKNPYDDKFGHMYTKDESFVWDWFEDLEFIRLNYKSTQERIVSFPSDGQGPSTIHTYTEEIYQASNLKHDTQFVRIKKYNRVYYYTKKKNEYKTETLIK